MTPPAGSPRATISTVSKVSLIFAIVALLVGLIAGTMNVYFSVTGAGSVVFLSTSAVGLSLVCGLVGLVCGIYGVRGSGPKVVAGIGFGISIAVVATRGWLALQGWALTAILF